MKKLIALALAVFSALAHAGANDIVFTLRNGGDNGQGPVVPAHPTTGVGIIAYDSATLLPIYVAPGTCLTISSGVLALTTACTPVNADWNASTGLGQIINKPSIPAAQVNADWAAGSGIAAILNKPSTFTPSAHTHSASDIVSGTFDVARIPALTISNTTGLQAALDAKFATPSGTTAQYLRGDGSVFPFPTIPTVLSPVINDSPGRSLVTSTSATGYQISATRNARACYEGSFSTTSTIGGPATATVFLETADTNSTTPSDWTTKARQTYSNTITLAVVLNQVQGNNWSICRDIPAGKYVRMRAGSISGTASASINTEQQETLY